MSLSMDVNGRLIVQPKFALWFDLADKVAQAGG